MSRLALNIPTHVSYKHGYAAQWLHKRDKSFRLHVRLVERSEKPREQEQMALYHYLEGLSKIGETRWYVTTWGEQWVALLSISAAALKCGIRDRWIGWDYSN